MKLGTRTLEYLGFPRIVHKLVECTATPMGRRLAGEVRFIDRREDVLRELERTGQLKAVLEVAGSPDFSGIAEVDALVDRAAKEGVMDPMELLQVADCLQGCARVQGFVSSHRRSLEQLTFLLVRMHELRFLAVRIAGAVDRDGQVRDEASIRLRDLRALALEVHQALKNRLEEYLRSREADEVLQERYYTVREDRYVLPVRAERKGAMEGIVHGVSQTGATLFVEPRFLISLNNRLKLVQEEIQRERHAVLRELSREVAGEAERIGQTLEAVGMVDLYCARARLGMALKGAVPEVVSEPVLHLVAARLPHLLLQGGEVVPNDVALGGPDGRTHRLMVLSGPNAGGKSVALKTCGLCVLMVRCGLLPPAGPDSRIPLLAGLHALPGDLEDMEEQLSTFTGHLAELNRTLAAAEPGHMVLVDEIAVGTEPEQGSALGAAFLAALADRGALGIVATHYERLKALALTDERFVNASMGVDWETLAPTYRLVPGVPGASRTLEIASRSGVPREVLERAFELLSGASAGLLEGAIRRLQEREHELAEAVRKHREAELAAAAAKRRREQALAQLARHADRIIRKKVEGAGREVDRALEQVAALVARLQQGTPSPRRLDGARRTLKEIREQLEVRGDELEEAAERAEAGTGSGGGAGGVAPAFSVGSEVLVRKFRRRAVILALQEDEGMASLKMGPMRLRLPLSDLAPVAPAGGGGQGSVRVETEVPEPVQRRLDLRGMRAQEGVARLERTLDQAMFAAGMQIVVIHGHGTGRMREAVRTYLSGTSYPVQFRPGKPEEGGEGVTIVET